MNKHIKSPLVLFVCVGFITISMASLSQVFIASIFNNDVTFDNYFPPSNLHFYVFGDGYYQKAIRPTHTYPNSNNGYTVNYFTIGDKELDPPPARELPTGSLEQGQPYTPGVHGSDAPHRANIDIKTSWNITSDYTTMGIVHFENILDRAPQNGCVKFYYDPSKVQIDENYCEDFTVLKNGVTSNKGLTCFIPDSWTDLMTHNPSDGEITWTYSNLAFGEERVLYVPLKAQQELPAGSRINFNGELYFDCKSDPVASRNVRHRSSGFPHDPNYKVAINMTELSHSERLYGDFEEEQQYITYEVQFHNDGNAPVGLVQVVDHIPNEIDPSSLVLLSSDHKGELEGTTFRFENINLPGLGMGADYSETISSFVFSACISEYIHPGDCVTNNVDIFFDNQIPVSATNTICADVTDPFSNNNPCSQQPEAQQRLSSEENASNKVESLTLNPNPTDGMLNFVIPDGSNVLSLAIFNAEGRLIDDKYRLDLSTMSADVSNFANGLYIVVLQTNNGPITSKFIKL